MEREEGPDPVAAEVIRLIFERDDLDPWLAFPQRTCCFNFGEEKRPLPIGALRILWAAGWPWTSPCPACVETLHAVGFGGLLSVGGVVSVCTGCSRSYFQQVGGIATMAHLARELLLDSEFPLKNGLFGGAYTSDGSALLTALGMDPPQPGAAKSEVSYAVVQTDQSRQL